MNALIGRMIVEGGGPALDAVYYCPHHPKATNPQYLVACDCLKAETGDASAGDADLETWSLMPVSPIRRSPSRDHHRG